MLRPPIEGATVSTPSTVEQTAPVLAQHEIDIRAPLDTVWRLHTNVNAWTNWQTDITEAHIEGPMEPGVSFSWSSFGFPVTSTVYDVTEHARVLWGGTAGGITGIHEWIFQETTGGVHVLTKESFSGAPVDADRENMQAMLDASLVAWLDHLKRAAEGDPGGAP
jgi:Polyketide cyclase / dehydrase and lipid transport